MTTKALEKFFCEVERIEVASICGFMTSCMGGSLTDNPFDLKSERRFISSGDPAELRAAWNRAFIQAQQGIMNASAALAILDFLNGDRQDYFDAIDEFETNGVLRDSLMLGFGHLSDFKMEMAAAK